MEKLRTFPAKKMQHLKVNICHRTPTVLCPSDYSVHPIQALCFVRPIEENITIIIDYMKRQTFGGYYICESKKSVNGFSSRQ